MWYFWISVIPAEMLNVHLEVTNSKMQMFID